METKAKTIIIGAIVLLVVAAILVVFFYQGRFSASETAAPEITNPLDGLPISTDDVTPVPTLPAGSGLKTFIFSGLSLQYLPNWGILTCGNSSNFELDPISSQDVRGAVCDRAIKPVTVLQVSSLDCQGEKVTLGSNQVTKSKTSRADGGTNYRWCLQVGARNLDITHRVSPAGAQATSKDDFSAAVEQMISTMGPSSQRS